MADDDELVDGWVNPLLFLSLDPLFQKAAGKTDEVDARALLSDLTRNLGSDWAAEITERHKEIARFDRLFPVVPVDDVILNRIVWPLRAAKQGYLLGDDLACIALSGCVGEMVACLTFEFLGLRIGQAKLTPRLQAELFGGTFEKLSQSRRGKVLHALGAWIDDQAETARALTEIRNKYLHRLSADVTDIRQKALKAYELATGLAAGVAAFRIGDQGTLVVEEKLRRYLRKRRPSGP